VLLHASADQETKLFTLRTKPLTEDVKRHVAPLFAINHQQHIARLNASRRGWTPLIHGIHSRSENMGVLSTYARRTRSPAR
jgi:hypothetical protein